MATKIVVKFSPTMWYSILVMNLSWKDTFVSPAISKGTKQLPNFLKIAETNVVLNFLKGVICDVSAYTVTVSFCCSTGIGYQKCYILVSDSILQKLILSMLFDCSNRTSAVFLLLVEMILSFFKNLHFIST